MNGGPRPAPQILGGGTGAFEGYNWLKANAVDSAAAGTALSTGQKTYNSAINWANQPGAGATGGVALTGQTLAETFKAAGKSVGIVTSVQWSHATPASMLAHNVNRNNYAAIAVEMLASPAVDVIMGAGHPEFNDNNQPATMNSQYVGGADSWAALKAGTHPRGWRLVQTKAEFEALTTNRPGGPVLGVAQVATTLQQVRGTTDGKEAAYAVPFNANVPTLVTMARGAINALSSNPNGFFIMVEGGAVDWANHANQPGRMIEEQVDFNRMVAAVVDWVNTNSNWDETLVIVTADHETGMLWGPNSATRAFDPIVNNGAGQMPGMAFNSPNHTNSLVPVYARGVGQELLHRYATLTDPVNGAYLDDTNINRVLRASAGLDGSRRQTRLVASSSLSRIASSTDTAIVGFIVEGPEDHAVVITGRGPSLAAFGVTGVLANPLLVLHDSAGREIARNDDWQTDAAASTVSRTASFALQTREAALARTLAPGTYTVMFMAADGPTGIGLAEVYSQE